MAIRLIRSRRTVSLASIQSIQVGRIPTPHTLARRWLQVQRHTLSASTAKRKAQYIEAIEPFFNGMALRNIRSIHCEKWVLERGVDLSASSFNHELRIAIGILQKVLLPLTDVRHSAAVLREFGNLSSPTVLFVLQAALHGSAPDGLWWMSSFGAGFSCHGALLEVAGP